MKSSLIRKFGSQDNPTKYHVYRIYLYIYISTFTLN